jgi:hypothetical protein
MFKEYIKPASIVGDSPSKRRRLAEKCGGNSMGMTAEMNM